MNHLSSRLLLVLGSLASATVAVAESTPAAAPAAADATSSLSAPKGITVRAGYEVTVAVEKLDNARFMEFDDKGTLYVSRPNIGDVLTFRDTNNDGVYEPLGTFASGLKQVHGLCFSDGWMWMSQSSSIHKARDTDGDGKADDTITVLKNLPGGNGHWWRSLLVTNDTIYTSVGDSGNISDETNTDRQKIWRFALDGQRKTLFASGIRNTEKLRFRPGTTELWGVDHGSDNFGGPLGEKPGNQPVTDLNPPCEFNKYEQDKFYGHPFITGNRVPRYEFMKRPDLLDLAARTVAPEWSFGAHWAPNGFCFVDPAINDAKKQFPADHNGDAFVAFHGSWNRSDRAGYCIARVLFDDGRPYGLLKVVDGLPDPKGDAVRPVDCVMAPDGSVLFSSDQPGRVYRLRWIGTDEKK